MSPKPQNVFTGLAIAPPPNEMEYTRLRKAGLKAAKVILGTKSFGSKGWAKWVLEGEEAFPLLEHAYSADLYSDGRSEEIIAKALEVYKFPRENVVILTKCRFGTSVTGEPPCHYSRLTSMMGGWFIIVKRLGTYIDVLQIHRMDPDVPYGEIMRALNDVIQNGWASSMPAWEFHMLQTITEKHGWLKFSSMQNYYNLLYRADEREMIPYCKKTGVGLIPFSPNARRMLARPWKSENHTSLRANTEFALPLLFKKDDVSSQEIVTVVEEIVKKGSLLMATVSTARCLSKGVSPAVGLNSKERINEVVKAAKLILSDEQIATLEADYVPKSVVGY